MATLPPWLQINPEQFTQAAIAGGQQGYQAAAAAGELAQGGLLQAAKLASDAAARAAEIAVRREAINAELAQNAARVAAAQSEAAAQNAIRQQQVDLARAAEENQRLQQAAELASRTQFGQDELALREKLGMAKLNEPQSYAPSDIQRLLDEAARAEAAGNAEVAKMLKDRATLLSSGPQPRITIGGGVLGEPRISGTPAQVAPYMTNSPSTLPLGTNGISFEDFQKWRR